MEITSIRLPLLLFLFLLINVSNGQCLEGCASCTDASLCTQCLSHNYIAIASEPRKGCLPCRPQCKTCQSETSDCYTCGAGYYMDADEQRCRACMMKNCEECNEDPQICRVCMEGFFLIESTGACSSCNIYQNSLTCRESVILTCQQRFYIKNGQLCSPCAPHCSKCSSDAYCLKCQDGYWGSTCQNCPSNCENCLTGSTCLVCREGYYLQSNICLQCSVNCLQCSQGGICRKCIENYYLTATGSCAAFSKSIISTGCISYQADSSQQIKCKECSQNYFLTEDSKCQQCSLLCSSCSSFYSSSSCLKCSPWGVLSGSGICTTTPFLFDGSRVVYFSNWNYPDSLVYQGTKKMNFNDNCPTNIFSSQVRLNVGIISGFQISVLAKIVFLLTQFKESTKAIFFMNGKQIKTLDINLNEATECSNQTNQNRQFTTTVQFSVSNLLSKDLAPLNGQTSNYLEIDSQLQFTTSFQEVLISYTSCHSTCLVCTNADKCERCVNESFLLEGEKCLQACSLTFYLHQNQCLKSCPIGTFQNNKAETWNCEPCNSACLICSSASVCASCIGSHFLTPDFACEENCPSEYFPNSVSNRCEKCPQPCQTCSSGVNCLSCSYNFFVEGKCVSSLDCPTGLFANVSSMTCSACQSPCLTCSSANFCKSCIDSTFLLGQQCVGNCPDGYLEKQNVCVSCDYICSTCEGRSNNCSSCTEGFLFNNTCLSSCPLGFYQSYERMVCLGCNASCLTCVSSSQKCTSCSTNTLFHMNLNLCLEEQECKSLTGSRIVEENEIKKCVLCPPECLSCDQIECDQCQQGYYKFDGNCLLSCPFGYFNMPNNKTCLSCNPNCSTCFAQPDFCLTCTGQRNLNSNHSCIVGCLPDQLYPFCEPCSFTCASCFNSVSFCTSCISGYFLLEQNGECLLNCYDTFYADSASGLCLRCVEPCQTCISESSCLLCVSPYLLQVQDFLLQSGQCVLECNSTQYKNMETRICSNCDDLCSECFLAADNCTKCYTNRFLFENQCLVQCPAGTYGLETNCISCVHPCSSCSGPLQTQCKSCTPNYFLTTQNKCLTNCPNGMTGSSFTGQCQYCSFPCSNCEGDPQNCTLCQQPLCDDEIDPSCITYFLFENRCVLNCPPQTYALEARCLRCEPPCLECIDDKKCLSCSDSFYLLDSHCYQLCPYGFYNDNVSHICSKCQFPCKSCTSETICLQCLQGIRVNTTCIFTDACSSGFFLNYQQTNGVCQACNIHCAECIMADYNCLICSNSQAVLLEGTCLQECPISYFSQHNLVHYFNVQQKTCFECLPQCINCSSLEVCFICKSGFYLFDSACIQICPPKFFRSHTQNGPECAPCFSSCRTCIHTSQNCISCINNTHLFENQCVSTCPNGTFTDPFPIESFFTGICRECIFPCEICSDSQSCLKCLEGYYLDPNSFCKQNCLPPQVIGNDGQTCIQQCPDNEYLLDYDNLYHCSKQCQYPFLLNTLVTPHQCTMSCGDNAHINEKLECVISNANTIEVKVKGLIDDKYVPKVLISFDQKISYDLVKKDLTSLLELSYSIDPLAFKKSRLLKEISEQQVGFEVEQQTSTYLYLKLDEKNLPQPTTQNLMKLKIKFRDNSHLLFRSQITLAPIQLSNYSCIYPDYEFYGDGSFNNFNVFGEVSAIFIIFVGFCLLLYNWYAKIYESLHLLQLLFLLSLLEIRTPPNIWLFLQGFKNSHFYFISNWFIDINDRSPLNNSPTKIAAIFNDSNFIRTCGHVFCLLLIIGFICLLLYLSKFGLKSRYELVKYICEKMTNRLKIFKWSHIHDFVMTVTMILFFGFFAQMNDYATTSTIQILAILFSFIIIIVLAIYYFYMGRKLHRIVRLSERDPRSFCDHNYLFRDNMMSITECAVHPKELYLNYLRAIRIIVFGVLIGAFSISPMQCTATIFVILILSALLYLITQPYPERLQNILLGLSDIATAFGLFFLSIVHFLTVNNSQADPDYTNKKWVLGWFAIVAFILGVFFLIIELIVSIVRGNSGPQRLAAQDMLNKPGVKEVTPNTVIAVQKNQFKGWNEDEGEKGMGLCYQVLK